MNDGFDFTVDWFSAHWADWLAVTKEQKIAKILEIGSFEGRSACMMVQEFSQRGPIDVFCIDTWDEGTGDGVTDMDTVEQRFDHNIQVILAATSSVVKLYKYKGSSEQNLAMLACDGHRETFDLVYVDGSRQAPDVLSDLIYAYQLCAIGGLIICANYQADGDPAKHGNRLNTPRPAIDAFVGVYARKMQKIGGLSVHQTYLRKVA